MTPTPQQTPAARRRIVARLERERDRLLEIDWNFFCTGSQRGCAGCVAARATRRSADILRRAADRIAARAQS
jgi:hypothetical protein